MTNMLLISKYYFTAWKYCSNGHSSFNIFNITQTGKLDKEKSLDIKKINYVLIDSIELKILEKLLATK